MRSYLGQSTKLQALSGSRRILHVTTPYQTGTDVVQLQRKLTGLSYSLPQYGVDGKYGPETSAAVQNFQQDKGLSITGDVGLSTWKKLDELSTNKPANGNGEADGNPSGTSIITSPGQAQNFWAGLSNQEQWIYGAAGATLLAGLGLAIYNANH